MFASLSDRLTSTFKNLRSKGRLSEADIDATIREIRRALLYADVAVSVVREFANSIRERALSAEVSAALNPAQQVVKIVQEELVEILGGQQRGLALAKNPPTVIMLAGLQGAGKTTFAGKLALFLKGQGHTPMLVAADLQRPNAVNQLRIVGGNAGIPVYAPHPGVSEENQIPTGDPVSVALAGVETARARQHDVVIVDTAGRLGIDVELMKQAGDIKDAINPDEVLFVIDAMIGQDAVNTAQAFAEGVDFSGVVLSKLDGDARGGAALSVAKVTGRPILFASVGEKLSDLEVFHPDRMASRILDMGDVLTLIEQAEKAFDAKETEKMAAKMAAGQDFTLEDFLIQMQSVRNMGSMKKMLTMLPGMGQIREAIDNFDEREVDRIEAIIRSMTPAERRDTKILNGSRRARIARGAGVQVSDVNQLLERFNAAQKMMRQMSRGGGMNLPGIGNVPGVPVERRSKRKAGKGKKKNTAKLAAKLRSQDRPEPAGEPVPGQAFGARPSEPINAENFEVPDELKKYFGQ